MIIQVITDDGEIVILNVCRSLVHTNQSHCPYQAAACLQHPGIREVLPLVDGIGWAVPTRATVHTRQLPASSIQVLERSCHWLMGQSHCPYQAAACLQHPGIREVLSLVDGIGVGCTNQSHCPYH
jgi:hypothetical protein